MKRKIKVSRNCFFVLFGSEKNMRMNIFSRHHCRFFCSLMRLCGLISQQTDIVRFFQHFQRPRWLPADSLYLCSLCGTHKTFRNKKVSDEENLYWKCIWRKFALHIISIHYIHSLAKLFWLSGGWNRYSQKIPIYMENMTLQYSCSVLSWLIRKTWTNILQL